MVRCESERSQKRNRDTALVLLTARLYLVDQERRHAIKAFDRKQQVGSGQRGDKRRTVRIKDGVRNGPSTQQKMAICGLCSREMVSAVKISWAIEKVYNCGWSCECGAARTIRPAGIVDLVPWGETTPGSLNGRLDAHSICRTGHRPFHHHPSASLSGRTTPLRRSAGTP